MEHTRFFKDTKEAEQAYRLMKPVIVSVLEKANSAKRAGRVDLAWEAISDFVARFPQ